MNRLKSTERTSFSQYFDFQKPIGAYRGRKALKYNTQVSLIASISC